jgi:hypothetical protein
MIKVIKYKFESVDTTKPTNPDEVAYALMAGYLALASTVVGKDNAKQHELFRKLDQALEQNEGASCYTELARLAQITKFSLTGQQ